MPDQTQSFYVPQTGPVATPTEGSLAIRLFRMCPNNDGGTSLPNHARIKVVVRDANGNGMEGVAAADICLLFNGGTPAQGFSGVGADSIIANSQFNPNPLCPDVRCVQADAETDATGTTYITFTGATAGSPGVGTRSPLRRWGHYDTEIPVFVLGFRLGGRLTAGQANGTYVLQVKNYDHTGGLGTALNQGEAVTAADFNAIANNIGVNNFLTYWRDFDSVGGIAAADFNQITQHITHDCDTPNPVGEVCPSASSVTLEAFGSSPGSASKEIVRCGTEVLGEPEPPPDTETVERWIKEGRIAAGGVIPVNFHVISCGALGDVPESQLDAQVIVLNNTFAGKDYNGNPIPGADSTGYTFVKNSVTRTSNSSWFAMGIGSAAETEAKAALVVDPTGSLNFYTCLPTGNLLGWATFPWELAGNPNRDGVVVHYGTLPGGSKAPYNLGGTGTHEVGHWVGLFHTFQGACHEDATCATAGDEVCDTPAEGTQTSGCPASKETCSLSAGPDPIHNYMDYSDDICYDNFTPGQDTRADFMMSTYRPVIGSAQIASRIAREQTHGAPGLVVRARPNPFHVSASIEFTLRRESHIGLHIFDVQGRRVRSLVDRTLPSGDHRYDFDGKGLSSGIYVVVLESEGQRTVRRITHMK